MQLLRKILDFNGLSKNILSDSSNWKKFVILMISFRLLFFISDGHNSDFDFFEHWGQRIVDQGFFNLYSIKVDRFECDYPPLYLYIIAPVAHLFNFMGWDIHTHFYDSFLKVFNLVVELGFLAYFYKKTNNKIFLGLMLLSPVSIVNAYGWGQIDILYSVLMFLAFYFIIHKKLYYSAIVIGISLSLKTQTILFLPLLGLLFLLSKSKIKDKILSLITLIVVYAIPNIPFMLYAPDMMDSINPHLTAAGRYNNITVNAFNFYWTLWADFDLKLKLKFPPNDVPVFGMITRKILAYSLFFVCFMWIIWNFIKHHKNAEKIFLLISFYCFSYFMLLPEMHERYLFPMFIFSAYVVSYDKREWPYFLIISLLHCMNLFWGWGEQKFIKQQWMFESTRLIALATTVAYVFYAVRVFKVMKEANINLNNKN